MSFKYSYNQYDQRQRVGVLPALDTEIDFITEGVQNGIVDIGPVPANKNWLILNMTHGLRNVSGATGRGYVYHYDSVPALRYVFYDGYLSSPVTQYFNLPYFFPHLMLEGDYLRVYSSRANLWIFCSIMYTEVNV